MSTPSNDIIYSPVYNFNYEVNLQFAVEELEKRKIPYKIETENKKLTLLVEKQNMRKVKNLLKELNLDDKLVSDDSNGQIKEFNNWVDNQYNPWYNIGGKLQSWEMSKKFLRVLGPFLLVSASLIFYSVIKDIRKDFSDYIGYNIAELIISGGFLYLSVSITINAYKK